MYIYTYAPIHIIHIHVCIYTYLGSAKDNGKLKVKITINESSVNSASDGLRLSVQSTLAFLGQLAAGVSAVDRGHRHSDGLSVLQLWISSMAPSTSLGVSSTAAASLTTPSGSLEREGSDLRTFTVDLRSAPLCARTAPPWALVGPLGPCGPPGPIFNIL